MAVFTGPQRQIMVEVRGHKELAQWMAQMGEVVKDWTPAWPTVVTNIQRLADEIIQSRGARIGAPWAPWSRDYVQWMARRGLSHPMLQWQGWIRRDLVAPVKNTKRRIDRRGPRHLEYGSSYYITRFAHFGTKPGGRRKGYKGRQPPRPVLGFRDAQDVDQVVMGPIMKRLDTAISRSVTVRGT